MWLLTLAVKNDMLMPHVQWSYWMYQHKSFRTIVRADRKRWPDGCPRFPVVMVYPGWHRLLVLATHVLQLECVYIWKFFSFDMKHFKRPCFAAHTG